jgi:hypothetical protein
MGAPLSYVWVMMRGMTSPVSPEGQDRYRCTDRGGPGGQRCQLLVEHEPAVHIARVGGASRGWLKGVEVPLPASPYRWFVSFPRDET